MKINKFKKVSSNKYKLYFDNRTLTIYEDVILKYNLLYKKDIDSDLLIKISEDNYKASIYDTAIKYISTRMRSIKEMRNYLEKKKFDNNDIDETINKLIEQGLLNDKLFTKSYINDKLNLTNYGPYKIKNDLKELGIDEIDLSNIDDELINNKLEKIIEKELKLNSKLPINKIRNKIVDRCINLGYSKDNIMNILDNYNIESNSNIKDEYNKIYKKYCNKYDEYKLNNVIKSKLYQKGYSIEEINSIVG